MSEYIPYLIAAGYTLVSCVLLEKPLILHTKKTTKFVKMISHRGGAAEGYENTLNAYRNAIMQGSRMLELDVQLSKDGQVVVAHDNILTRLTGQNIRISNTKFCDLPLIQKKVPVDFDPGQFYVKDKEEGIERQFATLDSVLKEFPSVQVNIDVKMKSLELVKAVSKIISDNNAQDRCVWGSFSGATTNMCYRENPDVGLLFSAPRIALLLLLYYSGLLPFVSLRETHLEVPMLSIFLDKKFSTEETTISFAKLPRIVLIICDFLLFRPSLIRHLADRGIPTYFWVLNNDAEFRRAFESGAAGVMTDYPSRLQSYCKKN